MLRSEACACKGDGMKRGSTWLTASGWTVAIFVVLLLSGGAAPAQRKQRKDQKTDQVGFPDDRAIERVVSEMLAAWQLGDVEMLHKYYADDVTVVSGTWEAPLMGWANFLRAYKNQRERMEHPQLERSNTYIKVNGNSAWATYQWEFSAVVDGKPSSDRGHTTLVLEKRNDRWVIVHNHTSIVPEIRQPAPAPGAPKPAPPGAGPGDPAG